ncbi:hypothetical protein BO94DRAFT_529630 [Aspergillus sclerotioniger CBS 115572]|uniref:Mid2 domain-containing protein n=1 Tax=Aspergillus sclerotioniger CBS 115572 TaxID=1450535 RepID=A0A317XEW6_9EURO|nr:hypothetical protein BO94DRAFT_529630 [Aspergillus sclerotioniger CBS 115572]PWY96237.1 hypothetical protein BO94DRAFT_529630 [Aspergillus sclerotioniger CBS 115572]
MASSTPVGVTTTSTVNTYTITTLALSTVYTPPAGCSNSFTYEDQLANNVKNGLLIQNDAAPMASCFPSGFTHTGRIIETDLVYSPGWCPVGYTSANVIISQAVTTAICCYPGFNYYTEIVYQADGTWTYAGCLSNLPSSSSIIFTDRESEISTQITGPVTMWAQPIKVEVQSSDLSLFVSASTTSTLSETVSSTTASTSASATSSATSGGRVTGISSGAEIGIGVGVGVIAAFILAGICYLILRHRKVRKSPSVSVQYPYQYGGDVMSRKVIRQMFPSELAATSNSGSRADAHELYA